MAFFNPKTNDLEAVCFNEEKPRWKVLKSGIFERIITKLPPDQSMSPISFDKSLRYWTVATSSDTNLSTEYLYDDETGQLQELFKAQPKLNSDHLALMEPIIMQARDGLTMHGYLTCPLERKRSQLPLVLLVHGGPWARDSWGFNAEVQALANRGYAVLQINYRSSNGYGKEFEQAGYKQYGKKMHDDLIDAVNWAIEQDIADPKKIAIAGASYGGYAALCGATLTPDVFCCAVDAFGMSNLITLIDSFPVYHKVLRTLLLKRIGDPETEETELKECSPLFKVDTIKIPLLIAHGSHDTRVREEESEQIVAALKKRGIKHEYLLFENEGHGFVNADNRLKFFGATERFLAEHLGGRTETTSWWDSVKKFFRF